MTNISHASLAGSELHEPKGIATAPLGTVYVANGSGSGNWSNVGSSSFTGMIADFTWPVVQSGWLELDGSDINTTTYAALYNVMTIQQNGTRTNGTGVITSLTSTANMKVGYYVFGTGIPSGSVILQVDSATQISIQNPVSGSGTATVVVSPWLLNTNVIRLPDFKTSGRYRRSRTSSTIVGQLQASDFGSHNHSVSGNTGTMSANSVHGHTFSGTTAGDSPDHHHNMTGGPFYVGTTAGQLAGGTFDPTLVRGATQI